MPYDPKKTEKRWQKKWLEDKTFRARDDSKKPKYYQLETFPYPSAAGLHVGHPKGYIAEDIHARYMRMRGKEVLYAMGWDAFGLPTENYAIKVGKSPKEVAEENVKNFKRQVRMFGFSYDWDREINTSDPEYYKWTQWLFIQLFKKGLAYRAKSKVNWCPKDQTVLANEQVVNGKCERCGSVIEERDMEQWFLKITDYAERLLADLNGLDWPAATVKRQEDWIGKSEGAVIKFMVHSSQSGNHEPRTANHELSVFTTRPDTLFGATYLVLAPEHELIKKLEARIENLEEVKKYIEAAKHKTELMRKETEKDKTGVELKGVKAINPATKEEIPIWVADYVLGSYGTGAIMAVPAHDERDFEFAKKFKLPIRQVVQKPNAPIRSYVMGAKNISQKDLELIGVSVGEKTKDGDYKVEIPERSLVAFESLIKEKMEPGFWNEHIAKEIVFIFKHKDGAIERLVLNDKNIEKIDRLACEFNNVKYDPKDPGNYINGAIARNSWYKPIVVHGEAGILINSGKFDGMGSEKAKREITKFVGGEKKVQYRIRDWSVSRQRYWGAPIPMIDCPKCGIVPVPEKDLPVLLPDLENYRPKGKPPLASSEKFVNVKCPKCGGEAKRDPETLDTFVDSSWYYLRYTDPNNNDKIFDKLKAEYWLPVDLYVIGAEHTVLHLLYSRFITKFLQDKGYLSFGEPFLKLRHQGLILGEDGQKMSKSKGNVVNPDELIGEFGADTVRVYEMFMGPFEDGAPWDPKGMLGAERFLKRFWNYVVSAAKEKAGSASETESLLHKTIKKVGEDIENFKFNTAISSLMILLNELEKKPLSSAKDHGSLVKILHPFAPHMAQELWEVLGNKTIVDFEPWPEYDPKLIKEEKFTLVIQVNGKVRDTVEVGSDIAEERAKEIALASEKVKSFVGGSAPKKIIYIPKKLVNIVI